MATTENYQALPEPNDRQLRAIDELILGATHKKAAEAAGVHRVTVTKWASGDAVFRAELNRRRRALLQEREDRIRQMDARALTTLAEDLESGDRETALAWSKLRQLGRVDVSSVGPTDPNEVIDRDLDEMLEALQFREVKQGLWNLCRSSGGSPSAARNADPEPGADT